MKIKRQSPMTGITNELDLPITPQQWDDYCMGALIQDAMPHLTSAQREFIILGCTDADWDTMGNEADEGQFEIDES